MPADSSRDPATTRFLMKFMWLSVVTAILTVAIKAAAAVITGSVGLWSDAAESTVNLVAAVVGLWALNLSDKPADDNHDFGHGKAEYMSSAVEGSLIFVAAAAIVMGGVNRLIHPVEIEQIGLGLVLSTVASLLNLATGLLLIRQGRLHRSITLEADGHHLITDVWTSVGVLVAIGLIMVTGWQWLDPVIAIAVGVNILFTGTHLVRRSVVGLLDAALPDDEVERIREAMTRVIGEQPVRVTELRTRESGRQRFAHATVTVPGEWSVRQGHDLADRFEHAIDAALPGTTSFIHVEPAIPEPEWIVGQLEPHGD